MFDNPRQGQPPFSKFIDNTKSIAIKRGAPKPTWTDVWIALTETHEFASALTSRGVSVSALSTEIQYTSNFKHSSNVKPQPSPEQIEKVIEELESEIHGYRNIVDNHEASEVSDATFKLLDHVENKIRLLKAFALLTSAKEESEHLELKSRVLSHVISNAMGLILRDIEIMIPGLSGDKPERMDLKKRLSDQLTRELKKIAMSGFFIQGFDGSEDDGVNVIKEVESLQSHPLSSPSPVEVVDFVISRSGSFFQDLLYRNGLRAKDVDREDPLEASLPSRSVQHVMMGALHEAYSLNSKKVTARHVVLSVLQDTSVRVHLAKLGIKDLIQLEDAFRKESIGMDEKPKEGISVHPEVGDDLLGMAEDIDLVYKENSRMPDVLLWLAKNNKDIDHALNKAGVRRKMFKDWTSKYDTKVPDGKEDAENKEKKKEGFEIPDAVLESLVKQYCVDVTALARNKKFDPMVGNVGLVDEITTKLLKRGKKNPIIIGEPGIGKTKVMEGLAQAIVKGDVPEELVGARLLTIDLHQMNDTPFIGIFEGRILPIIKGIAERNATGAHPRILLGLDEFAEAQEAGGHSHSPGFKGLIKPYLTSGDVFMIAATTEKEYREKVERDPALARRLQPVFMKEPTVSEAAQILVGIKPKYSTHHKLRIPNALLEPIAEMAGTYIHTVNQPDKSIDLFDEACALARKGGAKTLTMEHVVAALSSKTNIPVSFFSQDSKARYATLDKTLEERVLGQTEAMRAVAAAVKRARAGFKDPNAPIGNFLFVGPTGVGKTETAKALAALLMGDENQFLVRFDMSEFQEKHSVGKLIGAPPGYVGYDEGGLLVKAVRGKPFAVYLYDEAEKAHEDVFNAFLAPMSDGVITDGRGLSGNMSNAINIWTSNLGASDVMAEGERRGLSPIKDHVEWQVMARPIYERAVNRFFRPEFLNRLDGVIYFDSLKPEIMKHLVKVRCERTSQQLRQHHGLELDISPEILDAVERIGFDVRYGARPLKRAWQNTVETPMAEWLLGQNDRKIHRAKRLGIFVSSIFNAEGDIARAEGTLDLRAIAKRDGQITPGFKLAI